MMESLPRTPETTPGDNAQLSFDMSVESVQEPFKYRLLTGHKRTDGSSKSTAELHTEYVNLTDELVRQMTDGVDYYDPETHEHTKEPVDYVVWLDKSARPVAWLTSELWPVLAKDKDGNVPKKPEFRFVNIDRNQWTSTIDPEGIGETDVDQVDPSIIRSLRSIFLSNPKDREAGITSAIDTAPSQFDGKTVMIVDEVRASGRTLQYSESFFRRAFPTAKVVGAHWMSNMAVKNGAVGNADLPVWYSDTSEAGRGIGNRNVDLSRLSDARVQRLGGWFLSTRLNHPDKTSNELRAEMHQLAQDTAEGKVFVRPSIERDDKDFEERAQRLNNLDNFEDYLAEFKERYK